MSTVPVTAGVPPQSSRTTRSANLSQRDLDEAVEFARRRAAFYCRHHPLIDPSDVESGAIAGAYEAWRNFDPEKGSAWRSWLISQVRWHIGKALRPTNERARQKFGEQFTVVSMDASRDASRDACKERAVGKAAKFYQTDVFCATPHDTIADPSADLTNRKDMESVLAQLPTAECWLMIQRYWCERSLADIAAQIGDGWSTVKLHRLEKQALKRLRVLLGVPAV